MIDNHLLTLLHANLVCYVVGGIKLDLPPEQDQLLTRIVGTRDRREGVARDAIEKIAIYWSLMKLTDAEVAAMDNKNETSSES